VIYTYSATCVTSLWNLFPDFLTFQILVMSQHDLHLVLIKK